MTGARLEDRMTLDQLEAQIRLAAAEVQLIAALDEALAALHRLLRRHSHCLTCHPEQVPHPLAVNGHEYNRRRKARLRRKNR